ncbi:longitudinals lacking protein, isoforms A/B/D/L-like isoform X2 [Temnothorax curvispinosus]|uniref:Longitudinals lacking protein, isoforms A/B/D/L-like isoform X2 n=1 Tax=Temnothorax curvispinosus TaxID=300111 RepID=A0A6J1R5P3_9HYME|nr:longitudinals lacking protein, isoforms A/B/D/L-like isoform X2 [Temnothorax curvispinosus]
MRPEAQVQVSLLRLHMQGQGRHTKTYSNQASEPRCLYSCMSTSVSKQEDESPPQQEQNQEESSWNIVYTDDDGRHSCPKCHKSYRRMHHMLRHWKFDCGYLPRFQCPYCNMKSKWSNNVYKHIRVKHRGLKVGIVKLSYIQDQGQ